MSLGTEGVSLEFVPLEKGYTIAVMTLARPEVSNALNAPMIDRMTESLRRVNEKIDSCRALVVRAKGKHFSGGADLEWMKQSVSLGYEQNLEEAEKLSALFGALALLPLPSLAIVQGAAYGGAVGLVACCDWAIASEEARFCLSEVKLGLLPATILPYLTPKIGVGALRRWGLTARPFGAEEARAAGLLQRVVPAGGLDAALREELAPLLLGEPQAQRIFKSLHQALLKGPTDLWRSHQKVMVRRIAEARVGEPGQKGLRCFFDKRSPDWALKLPDQWKLPEL